MERPKPDRRRRLRQHMGDGDEELVSSSSRRFTTNPLTSAAPTNPKSAIDHQLRLAAARPCSLSDDCTSAAPSRRRFSVEKSTHTPTARSGDGRKLPPRRSTNTQISALINTATCARNNLWPMSPRRLRGAGNSIDTSACVNASASVSDPNTHGPANVSTASSVMSISLGWLRRKLVAPG